MLGRHIYQSRSLFFGGEVLTIGLQEMAFETSQKYKEGKFIIEKARLLKVGHSCTCSSVCAVWILLA